ncbi:MAG: penicillin-binding transpeptidase domain-containing protein, partial [Blastocatellia bacterium]
VTSPDGREVFYRPEREERQVLRPETAAQMTRLMEGVITEGTGRQAIQFEGFTVAGKTGTTQKWSERGGYKAGLYMPSFLGFVPATEPRFAMVVMIDEPSAGAYYGGVVAAPLFARLAEVVLGDHEVQPDDPRYREVIDRLAQLGPTQPAARPVTDGDEIGAPPPTQTSALPSVIESRAAAPPSDLLPQSQGRATVPPTLPAEIDSRRALSKPSQNSQNSLSGPLPASIRARPKGAATPMPDLRGLKMRPATEACLNLHLDVKHQGRGSRVVSQTPSAGAPVWPGDLCQIILGEEVRKER